MDATPSPPIDLNGLPPWVQGLVLLLSAMGWLWARYGGWRAEQAAKDADQSSQIKALGEGQKTLEIRIESMPSKADISELSTRTHTLIAAVARLEGKFER